MSIKLKLHKVLIKSVIYLLLSPSGSFYGKKTPTKLNKKQVSL